MEFLMCICICVCLCKYIYAIRLHINMYIMHIIYIYIYIFTEVDIYSRSRLYLQGMLTWVFCLQCRTKLCTNYSRSKHDLLNDVQFFYRKWNTTPVQISHHSGKSSIKIISRAEFCQSNHKPKFELLLQKKSSAPLEPSKQRDVCFTRLDIPSTCPVETHNFWRPPASGCRWTPNGPVAWIKHSRSWWLKFTNPFENYVEVKLDHFQVVGVKIKNI